MIKWFAAVAVVWALVIGATLTKASGPAQQKQDVPEITSGTKRGSIVRLHDPKEGHFFCSGVIVGKSTLLTANHCTSGMFAEAAFGEVIAEIRDADGEPTGIMATFVAGNGRADYAILTGDFSSFAIRGHSADPHVILDNIENNGRSIMACGYPYGGKLMCSPVTDRHMMAFYIAGHGYLYPGMSGGPVVDVATGIVIGVNSAVTEENVLLAPLIEIYAALNVSPE